MTKQTRGKLKPEFKAKVTLEAAKEQFTMAELPLVILVSAVFFRYFERPFMDKDWWEKFKVKIAR